MSHLPNLSCLAHTWLIDIDGTLLSHNGYKTSGDEILPGVIEFWSQIPIQDYIVLLSARSKNEMPATLAFLDQHGIRYNHVIFDIPVGERIIINDRKPSGLETALALTVTRDLGLCGLAVTIDHNL